MMASRFDEEELPSPNGSEILDGIVYQRLSTIPAQPIKWLWPGKIAKGKLSIIVGNPGLGKSQVCASLAAIVTTGGYWPVDRTQAQAGNVVVLSAEDDAEDTIRPRMEAAGADVRRVFLLQAIKYEDEAGATQSRGFSLVNDTYRLGTLIKQIGDVELVIIDPITAYMGATDSHRNAEVRSLLAPLQMIGALLNPAMIAVSHLTKAQGVEALQRVQGSIAFAAAARAVWGVAKDKDDERRRLFLPLKNNLGVDTSGYAFGIHSTILEGSDPPISTSHVMWEKERVTVNADEAFSSLAKDYYDNSELEEVKDFLRGLLAVGPMRKTEIESNIKGAGHSWSTCRRAQTALKIVAYKGEGFREPWYWKLP
jgi:hypothetical protein